jgi:hypothetical protein
MMCPVANSITPTVSIPPGRSMISGATIAGSTPGSSRCATVKTSIPTPSATVTTMSAWYAAARCSVTSSRAPTPMPSTPATITPGHDEPSSTLIAADSSAYPPIRCARVKGGGSESTRASCRRTQFALCARVRATPAMRSTAST